MKHFPPLEWSFVLFGRAMDVEMLKTEEYDSTRLISSLALGSSSSTISGGSLQKNPPRQLMANPIQFSNPGSFDESLLEFR
jgi:hypothetical protein